ncbi:type IV secretory system conjugative DNA transfer family protein [Streptococcus sp. FSL W8-0197]|jgi:hypothetical protein|uniref:type IV secretory system conjugative DNA transfer family protein n=1 Tax=Streptococcus TaxID=1301 RepID=UPI001C1EE7A5|nr:type IV secretory system conjugative DNA transfer family protein [Streptococcus oralis]MBU6863200.1 type IV secretory system conjugative DNA transfer family protein [Streptococcus oralis]MCM3310387.1 type IV secretory system conjugative DNA transfer family protein [Streptococcus oralis]
MVDSKPLLKRGGGKIGWSIPSPTINFLVLGNVGSGKSVVAKMLITNIFMENLKKPKQLSPMLIVSEIKQEDWLDFEESSNVFLGWQAHKAIELTYNEMMYRQENKTRKRTPLILLIEEVTVLMSSLEGKQKSKIQKMLKSIILSGRSRSIFCCFVSQDLLSHDGIDTNLRNQFGAVLDLGNMVSRSAISSSIFDLELGQKLSTLPKKHGWYQVFDGSPPIKVKVANIRDIDKVQEVLLEMLNRYQPTEQVR